jgi:hypothetical protein
MITTTLERIRKHHPYEGRWRKLLEGLGKTTADDEPLPFARIVEICGLDAALWCCQAEPQYDREWRLFAVWCARQVQHLMTDPRSVAALDVAERYARGEATDKELSDALTKARAAKADAAVANYNDVYWCAIAITTTLNRAWHAADAANAWYAAVYAAERAVRAAQTEEFLRVVNETEGRNDYHHA